MVIVKKREKAENLTGCDFKRFKEKSVDSFLRKNYD